MADGLGGMGGGPSDELLGIMYDNGAFKDVETTKYDDGQSDHQRMLDYGKLHKKRNFLQKLFHKNS